MTRHFLALIFLITLSPAVFGQSIKQVSPQELNRLVDAEDAQIELISPTNHTKNYFEDEFKTLAIEFSQLDIENSIPPDLKITVDSISKPIESLSPILITGLKEGTHRISFESADTLPFKGDTEIEFMLNDTRPMFENDAIVFGILLAALALIFWTSKLKSFSKFYSIVPALLLCYFVPAIFNSLDIINHNVSGLYGMAKNFLLPAALLLLCLSIDLKGIMRLGPKALIMFFTATVGIMLGGPLALWIYSMFDSSVFVASEGQEIWRGLSTVAGSWIGGGANQTAMKEIADCGDVIYSQMIIVDVFIANIFMAVILLGVGKQGKLNRWFKADNTGIEKLQVKMADYTSSVAKVPTFKDVMVMIGVAFGGIGLAHVVGETMSPLMKAAVGDNDFLSFLSSKFFWLVVMATIFGIVLSFTKARKMEGVGASRIGSMFIYILVATIGMKMDIPQLISNWAVFYKLIIIGLIWICFHGLLLLIMAKLIKAPFFFAAVGSQANVGGAASAPVVAGAFHPSLAPVGVLLAVLGYAVGTIAAIICSGMMQGIST